MEIPAVITEIIDLCQPTYTDLFAIYLTLSGVKPATTFVPNIVEYDDSSINQIVLKLEILLKPIGLYVEHIDYTIWIINTDSYDLYNRMRNHINVIPFEILKGKLLGYFTPINIFETYSYKSSSMCRIKCIINNNEKLTSFGVMGQKIVNKTEIECDTYFEPFINALIKFNTLDLPIKLISIETVYCKDINDKSPIVKNIIID